MEKCFVIYKVTNKANGKIYIGKTYDFEKRKREHFYDIDNELPFHRALKKYGFENFDWEIIDEAKTDKEAREKEIYWIKHYHSCIHEKESHGYNITVGGEGGVSWNSRPVVRFNLQGIYIDEFISAACADIMCGIFRGAAQRGCQYKRISSGYQWRYKDEWDGENIGEYIKEPSVRRKRIIQINSNGNVENIWESIAEASRTLGIERTNIVACLTGKTGCCFGYKWIYENQYDISKDYSFEDCTSYSCKIICYDLQGNFLKVFDSISDAGRELGCQITNIAKCVRGERKSTGGYQFKLYSDNYEKRIMPYKTNELEAKYKAVYQYDLDGNFIKKYHSVMACARENNLNRVVLGRKCKKMEPYRGKIYTFEKMIS